MNKRDPIAELTGTDELSGAPDSWNGYNWNRPSLAVVVSNGSAISVPWTVGAHVAFELKEYGLGFEDLGLDDAPIGISVWEGTVQGGNKSWNGDYDDTYLEGTFREPTEAEWESIRHGRCPWNDTDWMERVP